MCNLDANKLADAARQYAGLRRWIWRYYFVGVALILGFGLTAKLNKDFGPLLDPGFGSLLFVPWVVGYLACFIGFSVTGSSLRRFRCPRCGEHFALVWYSSWPTDRCKHCELDLGPAAMATAKPSSEMDL